MAPWPWPGLFPQQNVCSAYGAHPDTYISPNTSEVRAGELREGGVDAGVKSRPEPGKNVRWPAKTGPRERLSIF